MILSTSVGQVSVAGGVAIYQVRSIMENESHVVGSERHLVRDLAFDT